MSVLQPETAAPADDPLAAIAGSLFRPMGVDGVYARTQLYEGVIERLASLISRLRDPQAEVLRFPPVMSRRQVEKSGYLGSFPNLLGCVCALHGGEAAIHAAAARYTSGEDWTTALAASDLVLSPAACYPLYPLVASRGRLPRAGLIFDVAADCFRREPSRSLDRLQSFRMREFVRIGPPEEVTAFRDGWMARARQLTEELALALHRGHRQRSVFRPGWPGHGGQSAAAGAEVRAADPLPRRRQAHRLHELQLSPRPFRAGMGSQGRPQRAGPYRLHRLRHGPAGGRAVRNHGLDPAQWPAAARRALAL